MTTANILGLIMSQMGAERPMKQSDLPKWESQDQTLSPLPSLLRNFTVCPMAVMALGIIQ